MNKSVDSPEKGNTIKTSEGSINSPQRKQIQKQRLMKEQQKVRAMRIKEEEERLKFELSEQLKGM